MGPMRSLMPHSRTILRARSVADHEVVVGAGGHDAEDELLGDAAAHGHHDGVLEVVLVVGVASSAGSCWVTPSAMPIGRIVTLWSGSACSRTAAHTAWPASW